MRRMARIKAMQILYTMDFNEMDIDTAIAFSMEEEQQDELAIELARNCHAHLEQIDEIISNALERYTMDRLNLVDKAIIRLAVSEMLGSAPGQVVINEALELTKLYSDQGDHKATSFNNRLLDTIYKKLR